MDGLNIKLQSLIDIQENPFVLIDGDYRIVAANRAYCQAYGIRPEAVEGRKCHEISHHSPVPCHMNGEHCPHREVFASGQPCRTLHIHYDQNNQPEHVRLSGHPIRSEDGTLYLGEMIFPLAAATDLECDDMRMIGQSPAFLACVDSLTAAAESEAPIVLYGESGVGKDLAARYIHKRSGRHGKPCFTLDCASITESLFESELFGHERGAFTGCIGRKQGLYELADGGTLFLDEVGEIPLAIQAKLLRVLETGEFRRVGGREILRADVRIVCATNRNLLEMVEDGRFRLDLYYRISAIDIMLPPLRERLTDIPALVELILSRTSGSSGPRYRLTDAALERLTTYHYPGNVRELRNILLKAAALCTKGVIDSDHILIGNDLHAPATVPSRQHPAPGTGPDASMTEMEARHIATLLGRHQGRRRIVARILGISERTLYRKINQYGLRESRQNQN